MLCFLFYKAQNSIQCLVIFIERILKMNNYATQEL